MLVSELSSSEDDESDDDEPRIVAPYDPGKQPPPRLPTTYPGFQLTEESAKEVLSIFMDFFKAAREHGIAIDEANVLGDEIIKGRNLEYQDLIRIALTGDTSAGKSATLNSLVGIENLTPEVCPLSTLRPYIS